MELPYIQVDEVVGYKKFTRTLPWISVALSNPSNNEKTLSVIGLVDSGSDVTLIDREVGEVLGYKIEKGKFDTIRGLGGGQIEGYYHKANLTVRNPKKWKDCIKFSDDVFFAKKPFPNTTPQQTAIFGTIGFFRHLIVSFYFPHSILIQTSLS